MSKKETGLDVFYRVWAPKLTSVGASIVIVGALFKIMHWSYAGEMLTVGLLTEAFLFLLGAFQPAAPPEAHYQWERVYPVLDENITAEELGHKDAAAIIAEQKKALNSKPAISSGGGSDASMSAVAVKAMDAMLSDGNLSPEALKNFGAGIKNLNDTAVKMKDMSGAVTASNEYTKNVQSASKAMEGLNKSYSETAKAMGTMANTSKDAAAYHSQIQTVTKNLGALNAVYEMELKDADSHLKAMNKFYSNLTSAMENMADASKESEQFKSQMGKLTTNITSLNKVYGNMLSAMKGAGA